MMKKESKILKYAVVMSLLLGGLNFGLSAGAVDISSGSELANDDYYESSDTLNLMNNIELRQGYYEFPVFRNDTLPTISGAVDIIVKGNKNTISGELYGEDKSGFRVQDGGSITFNDITFDSLTYQHSSDSGSASVTLVSSGAIVRAGAVADSSDKSEGSFTINNTTFSNNTSSIDAERAYQDAHVIMNGGLVANDSSGNKLSSLNSVTFTNNNTTANAHTDTALIGSDHTLHSTIRGGAVYNTGNMEIKDTSIASTTSTANISNINNHVTSVTAEVFGGALYNSGTLTITSNSSFSGNSAIAQAADASNVVLTAQGGALYNAIGGNTTISGTEFNGNSAQVLNGTAQGGAIYNAGTLNISGSTFLDNSVSGTDATAQGGAIYNAANAVININDSSFSGNSQNGAANDIYFAENSMMNVTQGDAVTVNSGLASADNTAKINIAEGGNLPGCYYDLYL